MAMEAELLAFDKAIQLGDFGKQKAVSHALCSIKLSRIDKEMCQNQFKKQ